MVFESAELSRVICDVYDAAVDSQLWPKALESCCRFLGAFRANLFWQDAATAQAAALYYFNEDPHFDQLYIEKYVTLNPVFPAAAFLKTGQVVSASDLVPRPEFEQTRFFREWVKPQGITDTFGAMLENEVLQGAYVSVHWNNGIVDGEHRHRLELLVPHLQRAVAIGRLFAQQRRNETALTATLDGIGSPVLLIGSRGRIVFANAAARTMLAQATLLTSHKDMLSAKDPAADRLLKQGLGEIESGNGTTGSQGVTVTLSNAPDSHWIANVLPLVDGMRRQAGKASGAIAAVFVRNAVYGEPAPLETLAARYDLTASEMRVVDAVARVSGLDAIAEALGISRATVKTHLNRIYRKCGARNQSDLIKLIAGIGNRS